MKFHPIADIFPLLEGEEFDALVEDIQQQGLHEPIILYEDKILDGRNRYRACQRAGIEPKYNNLNGNISPTAYVISANLKRRHLTPGQRATAAVMALPLLEAEAKKRQAAAGPKEGRGKKRPLVPFLAQAVGKSVEQAAQIFGVSHGYVSDAKKLSVESPELFEQVKNGRLTIKEAFRKDGDLNKDHLRKQREESGKKKTKDSKTYRLIREDISTLLPQIESSSIDVIITDPPYPREYLPLYENLAQVSARVLKPGALLIVMCGQSYLPEIMHMMTKHMIYHWTSAYLTPGGQSPQLFQRKVNTFWKPLLIFSNGIYSGKWFGDVCKSATNDNDKSQHDWGQSESGMSDIVERFSSPNDLILDPFTGASTTGVCAIKLGRRFIGFDCDESKINISAERLSHL